MYPPGWTEEDDEAARILYSMRMPDFMSPFKASLPQEVPSSHMTEEADNTLDEMLSSVNEQTQFQGGGEEDYDDDENILHSGNAPHRPEEEQEYEEGEEQEQEQDFPNVKRESESPHYVPHSPFSANFPSLSPIYAPDTVQDTSVSPAFMMRSPTIDPTSFYIDPQWSPGYAEYKRLKWEQEMQKRQEQERDADVPPMNLDSTTSPNMDEDTAQASSVAKDEYEDNSNTQPDAAEESDLLQDYPEIKVKIEKEEDDKLSVMHEQAQSSKFRTPFQPVVPSPPTPSQYFKYQKSVSPLPDDSSRRVTRALARTRSLSATTTDVSPSPHPLKGTSSQASQQLIPTPTEVKPKTGIKIEMHRRSRSRSGTPAVKIEKEDTPVKKPPMPKSRLPPHMQRSERSRSLTVIEEPGQTTENRVEEEGEKEVHHPIETENVQAEEKEKSKVEPKQSVEEQDSTAKHPTAPNRKPILASNPPSPVKILSLRSSEASVDNTNQNLKGSKNVQSAQDQALEEMKDRKGEKLFLPRSASSEPVQKAVEFNPTATEEEVEALLQPTRIMHSNLEQKSTTFDKVAAAQAAEDAVSITIADMKAPSAIAKQQQRGPQVPQGDGDIITGMESGYNPNLPLHKEEQHLVPPSQTEDNVGDMREPIRIPSTSPSYVDEMDHMEEDDDFYEDSHGLQTGSSRPAAFVAPSTSFTVQKKQTAPAVPVAPVLPSTLLKQEVEASRTPFVQKVSQASQFVPSAPFKQSRQQVAASHGVDPATSYSTEGHQPVQQHSSFTQQHQAHLARAAEYNVPLQTSHQKTGGTQASNVPEWLRGQLNTASTSTGYNSHLSVIPHPMHAHRSQNAHPWIVLPLSGELEGIPSDQQVYQMTCPQCQDCGSNAIGTVQYYGTCSVGPQLATAVVPPRVPLPLKQMPVKVAHADLPHHESKSSSEASLEQDDEESEQKPLIARVSVPTAQELRQNFMNGQAALTSQQQRAPSHPQPSTRNAMQKTVRPDLPPKAERPSPPKKKVSTDHKAARTIPEKQVKQEKMSVAQAVEKVKQSNAHAVQLAAEKVRQTNARSKQSKQPAPALTDMPSTSRHDKKSQAQPLFTQHGFNASRPGPQLGLTSRPPGRAQMAAMGTVATKLATPGYLAAAEGRYTRNQPISGPQRISDFDKKPVATTGLLQSGALAVRRMPARQPTPPEESNHHQGGENFKQYVQSFRKAKTPFEEEDDGELLSNEESEDSGNDSLVDDEPSSTIAVKAESVSRPRQTQQTMVVGQTQRKLPQRVTKSTIARHTNSQQQAEDGATVPARTAVKQVRIELPHEHEIRNAQGTYSGQTASDQVPGGIAAQPGRRTSRAVTAPLKSAMKPNPPQKPKIPANRRVQQAQTQAMHTNTDQSDSDGSQYGRQSPGVVAMPVRTQSSTRPTPRNQPVPTQTQTGRPRRAATTTNYAEVQSLVPEEDDDEYGEYPEEHQHAVRNPATSFGNHYSQSSTSQVPPAGYSGHAIRGRGRGRGSSLPAQQPVHPPGARYLPPANTQRANVTQTQAQARQSMQEDWDDMYPDLSEDSDGEDGPSVVPMPPKGRAKAQAGASQAAKSKGRTPASAKKPAAKSEATPRKRKRELLESDEDDIKQEDENEAEYKSAAKKPRQTKTPGPKTKATPARKSRATKK